MLEQAAENAASDHELGLIDTSIISQAISLKRIADALERLQVPAKQPVIMSAEEYDRYLTLKERATNLGDIIFNKS